MNIRSRCALVLISATGLLYTAAAAVEDPFAWPAITAQTRPWAYWWWLGSAVDKVNLTKELTRYREGGLGGVHIIPIYGAKGWEDKYITYLSPKWMEMMGWSVSEAHRLGLGVDMTTGAGWCFGGPHISDQEANASVVVKTYNLAAGERLKENFNREATQALVAFSPDGKAIELTSMISTDGAVDFSPPSGKWTVYAISQKPSGRKVKRVTPDGQGWMLNPIYPPAMDDYLKPFTTAFASYQGPKPRAQYHDSYEYISDWSPNFFVEFEERRGYELQSELPALFHGAKSDDHAARVKCDYRQTVFEMIAQESVPKWVNWSHEQGFLTRDQAHGTPGNLLDIFALVDIPEADGFSRDRDRLTAMFASSAAHVTGKRLVSSETGTWMAEHFTETLGELKALADLMFLSGVNHIFYHGCCYSPDEAGWPGWHFYASTEMNPRNSIWHDAAALNDYIARCQSVLQFGQPDNDILLYWPIADLMMQPDSNHSDTALLPQFTINGQTWFEDQPIGATAKELLNRGYTFDYVSDAQLQAAKVARGKLQMPGGEYQVIVVPECKFIPLESFKRLLGLAKEGATVIFDRQLPIDVPGAGDLERQRAEFKQLSRSVSYRREGAGFIGKGRVFNLPLPSALNATELPREAMMDAGLSFIRRSFAGGWHYFISNRATAPFDGWLTLGRAANSIVFLDPMTGHSGVAARRGDGKIHLQLAVGQSMILRALDGPTVKGPAWKDWQTNGQPVEIVGQWTVKFIEGGPRLPADLQTARLASWTTFPDTNTQAFAGTAKYETAFDAPESLDGRLRACLLDLGDVRQSARVKVNDKDFGTLIMPPFRVVVDNLKPTGNRLEVEVTSVAANRIRDLDRRGVDWKTFHDINFRSIHGGDFDASKWPLTDCGLLGPVSLCPLTPESGPLQ